MKKTYICPTTKLVSTLFDEEMMNGGSVYGSGTGLDSGISGTTETEDPNKDDNGDFYGDAKQFTYDPSWSDFDFEQWN